MLNNHDVYNLINDLILKGTSQNDMYLCLLEKIKGHEHNQNIFETIWFSPVSVKIWEEKRLLKGHKIINKINIISIHVFSGNYHVNCVNDYILNLK